MRGTVSTKPDLHQYSDLDVLRVCVEESPEFGDIIEKLIGDGLTDEQIVRKVAEAGGTAQMLHYGAKCVRAMRAIGVQPR